MTYVSFAEGAEGWVIAVWIPANPKERMPTEHLGFWCGPEAGGQALAPMRAGVAVFPDEATAVRAFQGTFGDIPSRRRWQAMTVREAEVESTGMGQGSFMWVDARVVRPDET